MYRLTDSSGIVCRLADVTFIPVASDIPEARAYAAWLAEGNTPEPASAEPTYLKAQLAAAVQAHIDAPAQAWGYDDARSAVSYVGDTFPRFHAEGVAIRAFRSACWVAAHDLDADVAAGRRAPPTVDELVALLPPAPTRPI